MSLEETDDIEIAFPHGPRDWRVAVNLGVGDISPVGEEKLREEDMVLFARKHERRNTRFVGRIVENCSVV